MRMKISQGVWPSVPRRSHVLMGEIFRNAPSELIDKVGVVSDNGRFKESLREKSITES
jgi:hypothetical protein